MGITFTLPVVQKEVEDDSLCTVALTIFGIVDERVLSSLVVVHVFHCFIVQCWHLARLRSYKQLNNAGNRNGLSGMVYTDCTREWTSVRVIYIHFAKGVMSLVW